MTTAPDDWAPGDPLMPDNGLNGGISSVTMTEAERATVIANDPDAAPPWWRPSPTGPQLAHTRSCTPCGVRWRGDDPCWNCGGQDDIP